MSKDADMALAAEVIIDIEGVQIAEVDPDQNQNQEDIEKRRVEENTEEDPAHLQNPLQSPDRLQLRDMDHQRNIIRKLQNVANQKDPNLNLNRKNPKLQKNPRNPSPKRECLKKMVRHHALEMDQKLARIRNRNLPHQRKGIKTLTQF